MVNTDDPVINRGSDYNYTRPQLKDRKKIAVTRSLKEMEEIPEQHSFIRVHKFYIVHLNEIEKYIKGDWGYIIISAARCLMFSGMTRSGW